MGQIISSLFSGFGITDVIDIAIVSFLIYKLLGFIRSTRAEQLAKDIYVDKNRKPIKVVDRRPKC